MKKQKKIGFSLLELILVLGVGTAIAFIKFQNMKNEQETVTAKAVGEQMKQVGEAVNGYISIRYDKLSTLTSSNSQSSDPGPRICSGTGCEITYQTLINEGLLPASYSGINAQKSSYKIILQRSGSSPNYVINGVITTTSPWVEGGKFRYDLLGKAMQAAGIDSGMTQSAVQASGFQGSWIEKSADYPNINSAALLAYRVGYDSAMYSVYLRRDGKLPMTGNLNMGANDINNAKNINGSGTLIMGGEVTAHNGYGDEITLGGDAYGNDYELRLATGKPLTIYSPNAVAGSTVLYVGGNTSLSGNLATNGLQPTDMPSGRIGIRTQDVYAAGTIGAGNGGNFSTYMNSSGNIYASGSVTGGTVASNGETYTQGWYRTMGDGGVYFQKYGGGLSMRDTATISAGGSNLQTSSGLYGAYVNSSGNIDVANDANIGHQVNTQYIWASGNLNSNYIHSNENIDAAGQVYGASAVVSGGRMTTNEFLQINGIATPGNGCGPNGLQGRSGNGSILSCVNGVWADSGASIRVCASSCGGQWPLEVGRLEHNGDWSSWRTLGVGCSGGYSSNWNEPVFCSVN